MDTIVPDVPPKSLQAVIATLDRNRRRFSVQWQLHWCLDAFHTKQKWLFWGGSSCLPGTGWRKITMEHTMEKWKATSCVLVVWSGFPQSQADFRRVSQHDRNWAMAECVRVAHCSASIDHAVCLACSFDEASCQEWFCKTSRIDPVEKANSAAPISWSKKPSLWEGATQCTARSLGSYPAKYATTHFCYILLCTLECGKRFTKWNYSSFISAVIITISWLYFTCFDSVWYYWDQDIYPFPLSWSIQSRHLWSGLSGLFPYWGIQDVFWLGRGFESDNSPSSSCLHGSAYDISNDCLRRTRLEFQKNQVGWRRNRHDSYMCSVIFTPFYSLSGCLDDLLYPMWHQGQDWIQWRSFSLAGISKSP